MSDETTRAAARAILTHNGQARPRGRGVAPLPDFTFKDTGITVQIRKVSPLLGMEIRKAFPPPKPPVVETPLGPEENEADPDYEAAMQAYGLMIEEKASRLYIKRGVECVVDQEAVERLRADMRDEGITLEGDDKYLYIRYICVGSQEDYQDLLIAISRRSQPTEVAVAEAVETFPS